MTKAGNFLKNPSGAKILLTGVLISILSLTICALLCAAILVTRDDPTGGVGIYSLVALLCSAVLSGAIVPRFTGGVPKSILCALCTALIMLLTGLILGGAPSLGAFMNYGCYTGVFALSALLFQIWRSRKHHRKHRRR